MSTTNEISKNDIVVGDGALTIIPFQFNWTELDTRITIVVTTIVTATQVQAILVEGVDYDIVVASIPLSITVPSIVLDVPLPTGTNLLIERRIINIQNLDYDTDSPFPAEVHERLVDRIYMSLSELKNKVARVPQFDVFVTGITNAIFPQPLDGSFLVWNGTTGEIVNATTTLDDLIQTYITASEVYTDQAELDAVTTSNAYTDSEIAALTSASVGLGNVDNTSDLNKPISTATQTALDLKADSSHTHPLTDLEQSGAIAGQVPEWDGVAWVAATPASGVTDHSLLSNLAADDHTQYLNNARGDARYYTETETDALLATNATDDRSRANHTGTQTLSTLAQSGATTNQVPEWSGSAWVPVTPSGGGVTSVAGKTGIVTLVPTDVGLANVDNTSDAGKPVSTAQQTALNLKANLASPTFTGTVVLPTNQIITDLTLPVSSPSAPSAGNVRIFARDIASRNMPAFIGPSGIDSALQPFLARNKIGWSQANGNGTTISSMGYIPTAVGTATTTNVTATNLARSMRRIEYRAIAATNAIAGFRSAAAQFKVGGDANGGFTYVLRFGAGQGMDQAVPTYRSFVGLRNLTSVPTDVDPTTLVNCMGVFCDSGSNNFSFCHNDATGSVTTASASSASIFGGSANNIMFELSIFCPPSGGCVMNLLNLENGFEDLYDTGGTNLPSSTTLIAPVGWFSAGGTSNVMGFHFASLYIETDF